MKKETKAIHTGYSIDPSTGSIVAPIHLTSTFQREPDLSYTGSHMYTRYSNPNRDTLEASLASLEGGAEAAAFSSGSAAMMTVLQTLIPGDHVVAPDIIYFGISELMKKVFQPLGIEFDFVDMRDNGKIAQSIKPNTKLIIVETPSNPQITVTDIEAVVRLAREHNCECIVDNTIATPILQNPIALGADMVIHATTKYIGGHSDVLGGVVVTRETTARWEKIRYLQQMGGAVPSPFDCWLTHRGIQTMSHRVSAMSAHAIEIAKYLDGHPQIEEVLYLGLESNPGHLIAKKQMTAYGGLMSFLIKGGAEEAISMTNRLKLIKRATSFGGTHSLIEHRYSVEAEGTSTPANLLRLSVGLEHVDDLIEDLKQALAV